MSQGQKSIFHTLTSEAGLRLKSNGEGPHELGKILKLYMLNTRNGNEFS